MKRTEIEAPIDGALAAADRFGIRLPGFAGWSRERWLADPAAVRGAMERGLGWDVTDFGRGSFESVGLCLCTLRNGTLAERDAGAGQTYAEKFMVVQPMQETPLHYHPRKTEDIINRAGGVLVAELHPTENGAAAPGVVRTLMDGVDTDVEGGSRIVLEPGQSVQVPAGVFHRFWAEGETVCAGEVSSVNDDEADNVFFVDSPRYPAIDEDGPARRLLVSEYAGVLRR